MMHTARVAAALLLLAYGATFAEGLFPQTDDQRQSAGAWAEKIGAGFLGEVTMTAAVTVAVAGVGIASGAFSDPDGRAAYTYAGVWLVSMAALVPAGCARGVELVGDGDYYGEDGEFWASYVGGFVGTVGALTLAFTGNNMIGQSGHVSPGVWLYVVATALPPVGATVGYNLTASSGGDLTLRHGRLVPPSVSFTLASRSDGTRVAGISVRLLNVRL